MKLRSTEPVLSVLAAVALSALWYGFVHWVTGDVPGFKPEGAWWTLHGASGWWAVPMVLVWGVLLVKSLDQETFKERGAVLFITLGELIVSGLVGPVLLGFFLGVTGIGWYLAVMALTGVLIGKFHYDSLRGYELSLAVGLASGFAGGPILAVLVTVITAVVMVFTASLMDALLPARAGS